jgi:hypothetical protein
MEKRGLCQKEETDMAPEKRKIKLGVGEYALEFDTASLMFFEEKAGRSLVDFVAAPRLSDMMVLLWAAVRREEPQMTLEHLQTLVPPRRFAEVTRAVSEALAEALGTAPEEAAAAIPLVPSA